MDAIAAMRLVARVVETGSLSEAGRQLGLTPSAVSRQITALEKDLGARLVNRTSRRLSLTDAGRSFYEHSLRILTDVEDARQAVRDIAGTPQGLLRISAPVDLGQKHIAPILAGFGIRYPLITLELLLTDRYVNLAEDEADLAIRIGKLRDSNLVARTIAPNRRLVCAAPAYLDRHGRPKVPAGLEGHTCLAFRFTEGPTVWRFRRDGAVEEITVSGFLRSNSGHALVAAATGGAGVIMQPVWMVADALASGRLEPLLTGYEVSPTAISTSIHAVYPHRRYLSLKVRVFIDFLVESFAAKPYWALPLAGATGEWPDATMRTSTFLDQNS